MIQKTTRNFLIMSILIAGLIASPILQPNVIGTAYGESDVDIEAEYEDRKVGAKAEHQDRLYRFCERTSAEQEEFLLEHPFIKEHHKRLAEICEMSPEERERFLKDLREKYREHFGEKDIRLKDRLSEFCKLSDEEREQFRVNHDISEDLMERILNYCQMSDNEREELAQVHQALRDELNDKLGYMKDQMKDKYDKTRDIKMQLERFCQMSEQEQKEFLAEYPYLRENHARLVEYCQMSPDEREKFRMMNQDFRMDYKERRDQMIDEKKIRMKDFVSDQKLRTFKDLDISDERKDELIQKFRAKHSDLTDEQRDELKSKIMGKFADHFKMKYRDRFEALTDQERDELRDRYDAMRAYKAELREKYQDMTDEQKDQFRQAYIDKVQDKRKLWLSPVKQMVFGINADEIECREGLSLVIKASNGVPMCLKPLTASKLIERGIVVPGN